MGRKAFQLSLKWGGSDSNGLEVFRQIWYSVKVMVTILMLLQLIVCVQYIKSCLIVDVVKRRHPRRHV